MTPHSIEHAYALIDAYRHGITALNDAYELTKAHAEHAAENECDGYPLDFISDARGSLKERIELLQAWIGARESADA